VSIKFQFELASHLIEAGRDNGLNVLHEATERLGSAIGEVRSISHDLRSSLLDTLGLPAAMGQLAAEFQQRSGLQVNYESELVECDLVDGAAVALFRIAQEGLTNIERHAQASTVSITLQGSDDALRLVIVDDGIGFNVNRVERLNAGIGLRNIRERVEHFGGRLDLHSTPGRSELNVLLPLSVAAA